MPYYMGDYYMGDPGFFSTLGGIAKAAVGFIPGVGPALSAGLGAIGRKAAPLALPAAAGAAAVSAPRAIGRAIGSTVLKHPVLTGAGAAGIAGIGLGAGAVKMLANGGGGCGHGHHIIKKGPHAGRCVRNRRMRVTNTKALRRAIRRAHGFAKIAKKCLAFTERRPHAGRAYFKRKTRKRM